MAIPKRKDVIVPHILNDFIVDSALEFVLKLLTFLIPPLDQDCTKVVYPLASLSSCPGFEVKCALSCGDWEAKWIKLFWDFVLLHHLRAYTQCQIDNILYVNETRRFFTNRRIAYPVDSLFILTQKHFALHKFFGASANLQKSIALDQLFTDFYSFSDVRDG